MLNEIAPRCSKESLCVLRVFGVAKAQKLFLVVDTFAEVLAAFTRLAPQGPLGQPFYGWSALASIAQAVSMALQDGQTRGRSSGLINRERTVTSRKTAGLTALRASRVKRGSPFQQKFLAQKERPFALLLGGFKKADTEKRIGSLPTLQIGSAILN